MKKRSINLTEEDWKMLEELEAMPEEDIDTSDIPEVLEVRNPKRGGRPLKYDVTVNLDRDIFRWWESLPEDRADLDRWINDIVRTHIAEQKSRQRD